jgi:hypothetical protein
MDEDTFNLQLRKFLKKVGVTSQREIEQAVRQALDRDKIGQEVELPARAVVTIDAIGLEVVIDGTIRLAESGSR